MRRIFLSLSFLLCLLAVAHGQYVYGPCRCAQTRTQTPPQGQTYTPYRVAQPIRGQGQTPYSAQAQRTYPTRVYTPYPTGRYTPYRVAQAPGVPPNRGWQGPPRTFTDTLKRVNRGRARAGGWRDGEYGAQLGEWALQWGMDRDDRRRQAEIRQQQDRQARESYKDRMAARATQATQPSRLSDRMGLAPKIEKRDLTSPFAGYLDSKALDRDVGRSTPQRSSPERSTPQRRDSQERSRSDNSSRSGGSSSSRDTRERSAQTCSTARC